MDASDFAFRELTQLWSEFHTIPRRELPFRCLNNEEIWEEFGISPKEFFFTFSSGAYGCKGNYLAAHISRELRIGSDKSKRVPKCSLERMQDMPSDVILEIFGHLHPIDLYSLIRTAKPLRRFLLSKGSMSVWEMTFARHEDIPAIPEGISPPRWATTLFAPPQCDSCGFYPAMVNYDYCDRRCLDCARKECCSEGEAMAMLESTMNTAQVNTYVRHTRIMSRGPHTPPYGAMWHFRRSAFYRKKDIETFLGQLNKYREGVKQCHPDAQARLEEFLAIQARENAINRVAAKRNRDWSQNVYTSRYHDLRDLSQTITDAWCHRLRKLGFHPTDVDSSRSAINDVIRSNRVLKLDTKTFLKFEQKATRAIASGKAFRIQGQLYDRKRDVKAFYQADIIRKIPLTVCNNLPSEARVCASPYIRRFIEWGIPEASTWMDTDEVAQAIHIFVQCWLLNSESLLLRALHSAGYDINESDVRSTVSVAAMSVFICPYHENMSLVGWEGVVSHIECSLDYSGAWSHASPILEFSAAGHEIVSILARSVNKDACSATIADFDADRDTFICADCPLIPSGDDFGTHFFTWRQAVEHGVIRSSSHRHFVPVSDETRRYILARQRPHMDPMRHLWACNHCPRHIHEHSPVRRANLIKHLAKIHGIKGPTFKNDWIYTGSRRPGDPVFLARQPSECFICKLCPPGRIFKLYREQALKMHLSAKHHLDDPIENIHWKLLDIPAH